MSEIQRPEKEPKPEEKRELSNQEKILRNTVDKEDNNPYVLVANEEEKQKEKELFDNALERLSDQEKLIIKLRFGLNEGKIYSLKEVGEIVKLSAERVRGIEREALEKLGVKGYREPWHDPHILDKR